MHGAWGVIFWILRLRLRHNETRPLVARFDHVLRSAIPDTPSVVVASARNLFTLLTHKRRVLCISTAFVYPFTHRLYKASSSRCSRSQDRVFFSFWIGVAGRLFNPILPVLCNALFYTVGYFRSNKDWGRYLMNEEYLFFSVDWYIWALMYSSAVHRTRL